MEIYYWSQNHASLKDTHIKHSFCLIVISIYRGALYRILNNDPESVLKYWKKNSMRHLKYESLLTRAAQKEAAETQVMCAVLRQLTQQPRHTLRGRPRHTYIRTNIELHTSLEQKIKQVKKMYYSN